MNPKVTVLIPNYKTLELTKLCLRLLRKFTDKNAAHFIVIDNGSQDESVEYLRSLNWIELIERTPVAGETPAASHSHAMDLALARVTTPYVLSIHTDTFVKRPDWLPFLLSHIENHSDIGGVGSWKLETKTLIRRIAKNLERSMQEIYFNFMGKDNHKLEGQGKNYYYLRSHCALYRMDIIKELATGFGDGDEVAGKIMHKKIVEAGYKMVFLPSETLGQYLDHVNHATMILNPQLGARSKTIKKGLHRLQKRLQMLDADAVLKDQSLDY